MYKKIYLKKGKEESLKRRHPWLFSGAINKMENGICEGDIVCVRSFDNETLAIGHYQTGSISVRILTFEEQIIDNNFWERRIKDAWNLRVAASLTENVSTNAFRLIHGEGDNLPGLVVDCYNDTAVVQSHSVGMHLCRDVIARTIKKVLGDKINNVYYKSDTTSYMYDNVDSENNFLIGGTDDNIAIENNLKFHADWIKGQKTGFFIDQRKNRELLELYSLNNKVLNMFCYTGGFSLYAMRGGAKLVHSVDSSEKAIELCRENVKLNFGDDERHIAYCEDAFKFLSNHTNEYDVVVLDPPAFAKRRSALNNAIKGYIRLNALAMKNIKKGSILFTFSCSQAVSKEQFRTIVFSAALQANRNVKILNQLHQPEDHPINIYHQEGEYLKGLVLYVE